MNNKFKDFILKTDFGDILKYNIMQMIELSGFNIDFIYINNKILIEYLNILSDYKSIIIGFDIEFYQFVIKKNQINSTKYYYFNKENHFLDDFDVIKSIREMGGFIFIKYKNDWYYVGNFHFYINSPILNEKYFLPNYSMYASVTKDTLDNMIEIENDIFFHTKKYKINNNLYNLKQIIDDNIQDHDIIYSIVNYITNDNDYKIFYNKSNMNNNEIYLLNKENYKNNNLDSIIKSLNKFYKDLQNLIFYLYPENLSLNSFRLKKIHKLKQLYNNDINVINNSINNYDLICLNNIINYSKLIGKELKDIQAIINNSYIAKIKIPNNYFLFDISMYNSISRINYGSAKLNVTFENIIDKINIDTFNLSDDVNLLNIIDIKKIHNPVTDSLMTFIISIYILSILK